MDVRYVRIQLFVRSALMDRFLMDLQYANSAVYTKLDVQAVLPHLFVTNVLLDSYLMLRVVFLVHH